MPKNPVDKRIKNRKMIVRGCVELLLILCVALFVALCLAGCVYKGAKVTEGTDLAIGLNVPMSEGALQLQVLNYMSGFRLGVDRNAILTCRYTIAETNSYLGVVQTHVSKTMDATVQPCEISPAETNATAAATSP